jgi:hypothetical protein
LLSSTFISQPGKALEQKVPERLSHLAADTARARRRLNPSAFWTVHFSDRRGNPQLTVYSCLMTTSDRLPAGPSDLTSSNRQRGQRLRRERVSTLHDNTPAFSSSSPSRNEPLINAHSQAWQCGGSHYRLRPPVASSVSAVAVSTIMFCTTRPNCQRPLPWTKTRPNTTKHGFIEEKSRILRPQAEHSGMPILTSSDCHMVS